MVGPSLRASEDGAITVNRFIHKFSFYICALRSSRLIQPSELRANKDCPDSFLKFIILAALSCSF